MESVGCHGRDRRQAINRPVAQTGRRKNGAKWLDFSYILMIGLTEFAGGLAVIEDNGESSITPWRFARGTEKIELP